MADAVFVKGENALYQPKAEPGLLDVPEMRFVMVDGAGDPNEEGGAYQQALNVLYAIAYTIKMSKKGARPIDGYFEFSVAPLEGLWAMRDNQPGIDYGHKEKLRWTAMLRQPDFVTDEVFAWASAEAARKKKLDTSIARLERYREGLCVQCMHLGPYDDEPATMEKIDRFIAENGLAPDYETRRHHEIYLSDPRRCAPEKRKTVLRAPVVHLP